MGPEGLLIKPNDTCESHHLCVPGTVASSKGSKVLRYLDDVKKKSRSEFFKKEKTLKVSGCRVATEEGRALGAGRPIGGQNWGPLWPAECRRPSPKPHSISYSGLIPKNRWQVPLQLLSIFRSNVLREDLFNVHPNTRHPSISGHTRRVFTPQSS